MSRIGRALGVLAAAAAVAAAPVVVKAPKAVRATPEGVRDLADAVRVCRATGLAGWELVDFAQHLVTRKFTRYSTLHLWESPRRAFHNSRGYCNQYNSVLAELLEELGFEVERVRASRVRLDDNPWWGMGHAWLRVRIDDDTRTVCASRLTNHPGEVAFVPVSDIHPFRTLTYWNTNNGMIAFTIVLVWRAMLTGQELPRWMFRPFDEPVEYVD